MTNPKKITLILSSFTISLFLIGLFYYWWVREPTMVSELFGINHYEQKVIFRIDWFPSFVHQFSFVIFTWLVLDRRYLWFSVCFWFVLNILFELGQAMPSEYIDYFPKIFADYFSHGTYGHDDMLAIVVATIIAYVVMIKYQK